MCKVWITHIGWINICLSWVLWNSLFIACPPAVLRIFQVTGLNLSTRQILTCYQNTLSPSFHSILLIQAFSGAQSIHENQNYLPSFSPDFYFIPSFPILKMSGLELVSEDGCSKRSKQNGGCLKAFLKCFNFSELQYTIDQLMEDCWWDMIYEKFHSNFDMFSELDSFFLSVPSSCACSPFYSPREHSVCAVSPAPFSSLVCQTDRREWGNLENPPLSPPGNREDPPTFEKRGSGFQNTLTHIKRRAKIQSISLSFTLGYHAPAN